MRDLGDIKIDYKDREKVVYNNDIVYVRDDFKDYVEIVSDPVKGEIEYKYTTAHTIEYTKEEWALVESITPYTETKTAYIGDTEVTFYDTPQGNLTVYFSYAYTVERMADRIIVSFKELEEVTDVTISIL